jgi:hypothetical protein
MTDPIDLAAKRQERAAWMGPLVEIASLVCRLREEGHSRSAVLQALSTATRIMAGLGPETKP